MFHPSITVRRWGLLALIVLLLLAGGTACQRDGALDSGSTVPSGFSVARLEGELDVGSLALITRAIRTAKQEGHTLLVLDLDTPGGAIEVMWKIQKVMVEAEKDGLEIACWIHNHAASAGALVALASKHVYMSAVGTIGSAMPVVAGPMGLEQLPVEDGVREKQVSFLRAQFRSMAEARGRPAPLAEAMIDTDVEVRRVKVDGQSRLLTGKEWDDLPTTKKEYELEKTIVLRGQLLNLTAREAVEYGIADGIADDLPALLDKLGQSSALNGVMRLERSRSEDIVALLDRVWVLLLIAGLLAAWIEFKTPGFGVPGIVAVACFVLLVAGRYLAGMADIPHIIAVAAGTVCVAVEIFVLPGTLWLGLLGVSLVVGGLILGSLGPGFSFENALDQRMLLSTSWEILLSAAASLFGAIALSRFLPKTPLYRRIALVPAASGFGEAVDAGGVARVGALGTALADLRPVGKVELDGAAGREWEARSNGPQLERGARVRVIEISAGRLVVEATETPVQP